MLASRRDGLKWFCAVSAATLDHYEDYSLRDLIRVALVSALHNTRLRPHLIYDGAEDAFTAEIRSLGAVVIHHRSPLYDAFEQHVAAETFWLPVMAGAFLRFEIPVIETTDEFVLYTDCDVIFMRDPSFGRQAPVVFGATSQASPNPREDMNSGVMLINVPKMREILPHLNAFTRRSLHLGLDQEILREFFGNQYLVLDRSLNWKPYWGWNAEAQIVHFHGPKPAIAREQLVRGTLPSNQSWTYLLGLDRAGYEAYTRLWYQYYERLAVKDELRGATRA